MDLKIEYKGCKFTYSDLFSDSVRIDKMEPNDGVTKVFVPSTINGKRTFFYSLARVNGLVPKYSYVFEEGFTSLDVRADEFIEAYFPKTLKDIRLIRFVGKCGKVFINKDNPYLYCENNMVIRKDTGELIISLNDNENVEIPETVKKIGSYAFQQCRITDLEIHNHLDSIGQNAFDRCGQLRTVIIDSVDSIGNECFRRCGSLNKITFGKGVKKLGSSLFSFCSCLREIEIPDTIESINGTFKNSNINKIYISSKIAEKFAEENLAKTIKLIVDGGKPVTAEEFRSGLTKSTFDLSATLKNRPNYFSKNSNIDMVVEYFVEREALVEARESGGADIDYANDMLFELPLEMRNWPAIDSKSFINPESILADKQHISLSKLEDNFLSIPFEFINLYIYTNVLDYLKYDYDSKNDVYLINGIKDLHRPIGYLALGFGKEKLIIKTGGLTKRRITKLALGPNVILVEKESIGKIDVVTLSEKIDYIESGAFIDVKEIECSFSKASLRYPLGWNHDLKFKPFVTSFDCDTCKCSEDEITEKVANYSIYADLLTEGYDTIDKYTEPKEKENKITKDQLPNMLKNNTKIDEIVYEAWTLEFERLGSDVVVDKLIVKPSNYLKYFNKKSSKDIEFVFKHKNVKTLQIEEGITKLLLPNDPNGYLLEKIVFPSSMPVTNYLLPLNSFNKLMLAVINPEKKIQYKFTYLHYIIGNKKKKKLDSQFFSYGGDYYSHSFSYISGFDEKKFLHYENGYYYLDKDSDNNLFYRLIKTDYVDKFIIAKEIDNIPVKEKDPYALSNTKEEIDKYLASKNK